MSCSCNAWRLWRNWTIRKINYSKENGSDSHGDFLIRDNSKNGTKLEMDTLDTKGVYIDAEEFEDFK